MKLARNHSIIYRKLEEFRGGGTPAFYDAGR
jgi:hypothetical protein